jgi:DNA modification methylase
VATAEPNRSRRRRSTSTSDFGVGRREGHDSADFYARFSPPEISDDAEVLVDPDVRRIDRVIHGSSTDMGAVPDGSVALVVTSPPYFAGKAYETELDAEHVPATYIEYLAMLREVFSECVRTLEPGGRIAVNVANLGRRPYRSLAADIVTILQDDLRLLLRGEVIWVKQRGASGSCAWGSFQRAANPVLRDLTERVIIASKGRFDRALPVAERRNRGLPYESTMFRDEFMDATLDLWEIPPESARRVGHPAPFPVALPERLINLYTYAGDLVLDPFMGSGTTAVAALRTGRHFVGYDTDSDYVARADERIAAERERLVPSDGRPRVPSDVPEGESFLASTVREGLGARDTVAGMLEIAGFRDLEVAPKVAGMELGFAGVDSTGRRVLFDCSGTFAGSRQGLSRPDTLWRALGRATALSLTAPKTAPANSLVLLSTDAPSPTSSGGRALAEAVRAGTVSAVVIIDDNGLEQLERLASGAAGRPGGEDAA